MAVDRQALQSNYRMFKNRLHREAGSMRTLALGFSAGVALGWLSMGKRKPGSLRRRLKASAPNHWLGEYIIWPLLLSTIQGLIVSRKTDAEQPAETSPPLTSTRRVT